MAIVTRAQLAESLWPGVSAWFGVEYDEYNAEWKDILDDDKSDRAYTKYVGLSGLGLAPKKPEGLAMKFDSFTQGYKTEIAPGGYALAYLITHEEMRDNQYSKTALNTLGNRKSGMLARSMNETKEVVGGNVYNRMFNILYPGADGVSILNTAHPNKAGGTFSNQLATGSDLSEASLEQCYIDISKLTDDRGLTIRVIPESLHIPTELHPLAMRILDSPLQSGTGNNDINALRRMGVFKNGAKVNHFFDDPNAFFIRTSVPGMVMVTNEETTFEEADSFDTKSLKYGAYGSFEAGNYDPRAIFGSPG